MSDREIYVIAHRPTEYLAPVERRIAADIKANSGVEIDVKAPDFYKIGISEDVDQRLRSMGSSTPHRLELVTTIASDHAEVVEGQLHDLYRSQKHSGEWYKLGRNDINSLVAFDSLHPSDLDGLSPNNVFYDSPSPYIAVVRNRRRNQRMRNQSSGVDGQ